MKRAQGPFIVHIRQALATIGSSKTASDKRSSIWHDPTTTFETTPNVYDGRRGCAIGDPSTQWPAGITGSSQYAKTIDHFVSGSSPHVYALSYTLWPGLGIMRHFLPATDV